MKTRTAKETAAVLSATRCDLCGRAIEASTPRALLHGRKPGTYLIACAGDWDCPMDKRPWKPVPPNP